jgi:hypothetical protein
MKLRRMVASRIDDGADGSRDHDDRPRCTRCGDVVGAFEPAVFVIGEVRLVYGSPLSVSPDVRRRGAASHLACWEEQAAELRTEPPRGR